MIVGWCIGNVELKALVKLEITLKSKSITFTNTSINISMRPKITLGDIGIIFIDTSINNYCF